MCNRLEEETERFKPLKNLAKSSKALGSFGLVVLVISITYIAIGAVYLHDCPVQEMIPIYLIVAGVFCIILTLSIIHPCIKNMNIYLMGWILLVSIFIFCWFITGNYWIYSVFEPSYNKNGTDVSSYCNKTLYLFSFWTNTLFYMVLVILSFYFCYLWHKVKL